MTKWVWKGLRSGVKTTQYPKKAETAPGISPGRPSVGSFYDPKIARILTELCPTNAICDHGSHLIVKQERCIHCMRCADGNSRGIEWENSYEWAQFVDKEDRLPSSFSRSLHIRILDAGACGACMSEIRQITNPYYNIHKLGFFITPTPRTADILLVAGPITEHMLQPLIRAYEAMPGPKRLIALGTCALSGGIFGKTFAVMGGIEQVAPVHIKIPGCPPPPLAILHGLVLAARKLAPISKKKGGL